MNSGKTVRGVALLGRHAYSQGGVHQAGGMISLTCLSGRIAILDDQDIC